MSARENILAAIRAARGGPAEAGDTIAREAAALLGDATRFQPKFPGHDNRTRFIERATSERLTATVDEVAVLEDAPAAVQRYLATRDLPLRVALPPGSRLQALDWGDVTRHETLAPDEPVVVNLADWAIAETGSLVYMSRPDSPTLYNFLPLHHVILLDAATILRYPEEYWAQVRAAGNHHPRSINFITGTSGTADIEAQNVRGAHGPRFMHIVIFGES